MGLLDNPNDVGLLSMGLRLMSTPGKFGQAFGQSGLGAMGDMQQAQQRQQMQQQRKIQEQLLMQQMAQAKAQQEERAAAQARQQAIEGAYRNAIESPLDQAGAAGMTRPTPENAAAMAGMSPRINQQKLLSGLMGVDPMSAFQMMQPKPADYKVVDGALVQTNAPGGPKSVFERSKPVDMNQLMIPDGKGGFMVNQALLDARGQIAEKGAARASLSVNTERSYGGEIAQGLAKADLAALDVARSAPDRIKSASDVKRILSTGNAITGTAAEQRLWVDKALSTAGVIDGTRTQATEDLVNLLANQTLDAIKTSGLGSGQGFTDKDRQFLQDAKAGRIEINAKTLYRMADLNEKSARASIAYGNKVAARLKGNPILGTIGQDLEVAVPPEVRMPTLDEIAAEARRRGLGGK